MQTDRAREGGTAERRNGWLSSFKRMVGMPDYSGYLDHMADRHPGCAVLSEREFFDQYVNARYGNGASRCC